MHTNATQITERGIAALAAAADQSDIINGIQTASHFQCLTS